MPAKSEKALLTKKNGKKRRLDIQREEKIKMLGGNAIDLPDRPLTAEEVNERVNVLFDLMYPNRHKPKFNKSSRVFNFTPKERKPMKSVPWKDGVFGSKKSWCKRNNVAFDLDEEWMDKQLSSGVCPILGIEMKWDNEPKGPNKATIDRIDPSGGYTKDNCWIISWRANRIKSDATFKELEMLYLAMKKKLSESC